LQEEQRVNIIRVLDEAVKSIKDGNIVLLKDLSNETIHDASTVQDQYSITIAIIIYSLSKIHERETHYGQFKGWRTFCYDCVRGLELAKNRLEKFDIKGFDREIKNYLNTLKKLDTKLKNYIQDVFERAKLNKASRIHEHGVSIGRTAELLGVSRYELMDYVGKTFISDVKDNLTIDPVKRMKITREIFK